MVEGEWERTQYQLVVTWMIHQDNRRWTLLSAFLVTNALVATAAFAQDAGSWSRVGLALVGVLTCVGWFAALRRGRAYLSRLTRVAGDLEKTHLERIGGEPVFSAPKERGPHASHIINAHVVIAGLLWVLACGVWALAARGY